MKYLIVLFLILNGSFTSTAQTLLPGENQGISRWQQHVREILQHQSTNAGAQLKTTQLKERVIGKSDYLLDTATSLLTLRDSFNARYSGIHASAYNYDLMLYTSKYNDPSIKHDTLNEFYFSATNTSRAQSVCHYNADDHKDTFAIYTWNNVASLQNSYRYAYVYSGAKLNTTYWQLGSPNWIDYVKMIYTYNASNKLVADTYSHYSALNSYTAYARTIRSYDAANNLISEIFQMTNGQNWDDQQIITNLYNANNKLIRSSFQYLNGYANFYINHKDSFGYNNSNSSFVSYEQQSVYDTATNAWIVNSLLIKTHLNSLGLPDSLLTYNRFSSDSLVGNVYYDSYNNPSYINYYRKIQGKVSPVLRRKTNYYYELFNNATGITAVLKEQDWQLYPNPAKFYIAVNCTETTGASRLVILNLAGQTVIHKVY